jgi:hypothetical protein
MAVFVTPFSCRSALADDGPVDERGHEDDQQVAKWLIE